MKINRLFSIAAAALMMVACSSEDTALNNNRAAGPQMQFTATIAAPGSGATTRTAYTESGTDINVTWSVGDEIALIHDGVKDVATVKTVNANGSATINGYVTGATDEENVTLYYPAARMISNGQGGYTFDPVIEGKKLTQDGTLKYIQDNLDFREGEGQLSVNGTEVTLKEPVKMAAENAIWKLALKDDAETPAALAASQLAIMIGSDTIASTAILSTATSELYLAVPGMAQAITIGATVVEDTYSCTNEGVTLEAGKYYQSTVTMAKKAANAYLKWDGTQKKLVETAIPDNATAVTNAEANVNWSAGTYVVEGVVNINGNIGLEGDVNLIIKDGARLSANWILGNDKNLHIYGQSEMTGQLIVNCSDKSAIDKLTTLEIHSCKVMANSFANNCGGFSDIGTFNVYGGLVIAQHLGGTGYGISLKDAGALNIYGGEVRAQGEGDSSSYSHGIMGSATITVYGGKLWAGCAGTERALYNITLNKGAGFTGKIQISGDNETWIDWESGTPTEHYVKVE